MERPMARRKRRLTSYHKIKVRETDDGMCLGVLGQKFTILSMAFGHVDLEHSIEDHLLHSSISLLGTVRPNTKSHTSSRTPIFFSELFRTFPVKRRNRVQLPNHKFADGKSSGRRLPDCVIAPRSGLRVRVLQPEPGTQAVTNGPASRTNALNPAPPILLFSTPRKSNNMSTSKMRSSLSKVRRHFGESLSPDDAYLSCKYLWMWRLSMANAK